VGGIRDVSGGGAVAEPSGWKRAAAIEQRADVRVDAAMVTGREVDRVFLDDGGEDVEGVPRVAGGRKSARVDTGGPGAGGGPELVAGWEGDRVWSRVLGGEERDSRGGRDDEGSERSGGLGAAVFAAMVAGREMDCGGALEFAELDAV